MRQTLCFVMVAVLGAAWGCADDEDPGPGGKAGSAGQAGSGGSAAGSAGAGGSAASGGSSGGGGSAGADASPGSARLLVAGTDFASQTEIATIDLDTATVSGTLTVSDGDAVPVASDGRAFVLERTNDVVHLLTDSGQIDTSISVASGDAGPPANPTGVVAAGGKAYVTLYGKNAVAVLDLAAGTHTSDLDLSAHLDASDADGAVDVSTPIHDPSTNRVYFTLARVDRTTIAAPSFELACPAIPSLLMALDASTGALVDLNGAASGQAVPLALVNPVDVALDAAQSRLFVLSAGCFAPGEAGSVRTGHGVEAVDLGSLSTSVALVPADASFFARLLLIGPNAALVNRFDPTFAEHWNHWTTSQSSLGASLTGVPSAPSYDGMGHLLGIAIAAADGGVAVSVVRYAIDSGDTTTLVQNPWTGTFTSASGSAFVAP